MLRRQSAFFAYFLVDLCRIPFVIFDMTSSDLFLVRRVVQLVCVFLSLLIFAFPCLHSSSICFWILHVAFVFSGAILCFGLSLADRPLDENVDTCKATWILCFELGHPLYTLSTPSRAPRLDHKASGRRAARAPRRASPRARRACRRRPTARRRRACARSTGGGRRSATTAARARRRCGGGASRCATPSPSWPPRS